LTDQKIYTASRIFTGDDWLPDHAIVVKGSVIESILPLVTLPASAKKEDFKQAIIAPAFVDVQIYGAYGKLLAVNPEKDSLYKLMEYCRKGGAAYCQPTVATNTAAIFYQCIDAVKDYWNSGGTGITGLHLEGPWINPVKRGAHIESLIHSPVISEVQELLKYGKGVIKMITLAPEICSEEVIRLIC
jgi:N-acetylglucosamine-6-phosphate deacetylase